MSLRFHRRMEVREAQSYLNTKLQDRRSDASPARLQWALIQEAQYHTADQQKN